MTDIFGFGLTAFLSLSFSLSFHSILYPFTICIYTKPLNANTLAMQQKRKEFSFSTSSLTQLTHFKWLFFCCCCSSSLFSISLFHSFRVWECVVSNVRSLIGQRKMQNSKCLSMLVSFCLINIYLNDFPGNH